MLPRSKVKFAISIAAKDFDALLLVCLEERSASKANEDTVGEDPPVSWRTDAILVPSGDHAGEESPFK